MKKLFSIAVISSFSLLMIACSGEAKDDKEKVEDSAKKLESGSSVSALEYNDGIVGFQMRILNDMMKTMKLEGEDIIADLNGTIAITEESIEGLENMEVYPGGEEMKEKALDLFNFYLKTMKGPWMEAFILFEEKGANMNEEELAHFQELLTAPGIEEVKYDQGFASAQDSFAKANGFVIQKNAMQDEIDGMN